MCTTNDKMSSSPAMEEDDANSGTTSSEVCV